VQTKIISVVGARPNFMKIAPLVEAFNQYISNGYYLQHILVHTGQHYDRKMSDSFFEELGIPKAQYNLGIGSGTHAEQVGRTMIEFEKVLMVEKPEWVIVIGDVNATLACSVTAKKMGIKVCHLEAGLRSGDIRMPEEINRIVTDRLSDLLLTPDRISNSNLKAEGVSDDRIQFVGNIMIDTLEKYRNKASALKIDDIVQRNLLLDESTKHSVDHELIVVTLHRPSNVDHKENLSALVDFFLQEVVKDTTIIWPIHPRTLQKLKDFDLYDKICKSSNVILLNPVGYFDMLKLNMSAKMILTDSGGLQEESCVLGTPCLTLRMNTERPVTLRENGGASVLVGEDIQKLRAEFNYLKQHQIESKVPELWDGNTASRCLEAILNYKS
jgi:UDP-N-acetylglucosamine 2-epimerase (non-hydrolysing)